MKAAPTRSERPRTRRGALTVADLATRVGAEVSAGDYEAAWRWLLQFVDDFRASPLSGKQWLVAAPSALTGDRRYDAAIAALVEHLCTQAGMPYPSWTSEAERFAEPWWFPAGLPALEAAALRDSPISFKRHGVLVSAYAFCRV